MKTFGKNYGNIEDKRDNESLRKFSLPDLNEKNFNQNNCFGDSLVISARKKDVKEAYMTF